MRQVFNALPYIIPPEDMEIAAIYEKYGTLRKIKKGVILKDGGDANKLYFLKSGLCMYMINYYLEKPRTLALILPGRAMGDITCVSGEKVNVTTIALRDSEVLVIPPEILKNEMKENFDISFKVTKNIIAKQECHLEGMIANFTTTHEERLATFYKALILSFGKQSDDMWQKLPLKLSNEEIGYIIHGTRVTVNRLHLKWNVEGKYKKESKTVFINKSIFDLTHDWHDFV